MTPMETPDPLVDASLALARAGDDERLALLRRLVAHARETSSTETAAGVGRELRSSLTAVASAAQLLRFRMRDDPVIEKNVGRILRETERLGRLAGALLEFGRTDALARTVGDPDAVWDRVIDDLRGTLESRSLKLQRTRATGHAHCAIDAERLAIVFSSLLENAAAAAPDASDLTLVSERVEGGWRCRLANGGTPLTPEALEGAFRLFYSTKPGAAGRPDHSDGVAALAEAASARSTIAVPRMAIPPIDPVAQFIPWPFRSPAASSRRTAAPSA